MKKIVSLLALLVLTTAQAFAQEAIERLFGVDLYIRNTRSGKYASSESHQYGPASQTTITDINAMWCFVRAGETTDGITPVKIQNKGNLQYINNITSNSYTEDEVNAQTWYLKSTEKGWSISNDESFQNKCCWNDESQNRLAYWYDGDEGSFWSFGKIVNIGVLSYFVDITGSTCAIAACADDATEVVIPEKITYNGVEYSVTGLGSAFQGNTSLTSVDIPCGVKTIEKRTFYGCSSLASVSLSEGLESINYEAFVGCPLQTISIPGSVRTIEQNAFSAYFDFVEFNGTTPPSGAGLGNINSEVTFVPEASLAAYQTALTGITMKNSILPLEAKKLWSVTTEAQDAGSNLRAKLNAAGVSDELMNTVTNLKITGTINSYDFVIMRDKLVNLLNLDLSEARIVENAYEHYNGHYTENDKLPAYAFYETKLISCLLPKDITVVGERAFHGAHLTTITLPSKVENIDYNAFAGTKLQSANLPEGLLYIQSNAFYETPLQEIKFPSTLLSIGSFAFWGCSSLQEIKFPSTLLSIGSYAFVGCSSLQEIKFPSSLKSIDYGAFSGCLNLTKVYTYTIEPLSISEDVFDTEAYNGTLYVPETAYDNYYFGVGSWKKFQHLLSFNEPYEYFYLNNDFTMGEETPRLEGAENEETGEVEAPDADLNAGSGFVVEGDETQELGDVHLKGDGDGNNSSSIIGNGNGNGNIHAKNLHIDIEVEGNRGYFFCFPYDINRTNIKYKGNYVFRYYDGAERAENGSGGWKDVAMQDKEYLKAGVGYIFQGDQSGTLTLKVSDVYFNADDQVTDLENHESDNAQNAGWNFVGNSNTSYFDIQDMGYEHPVTVWNGSTYEAISPQDDDHVFHPYQAFFVQKPNGTTQITFSAEARQTKTQAETNAAQSAAKRRVKSAAVSLRKVVNLTISNETGTDKTRVVFNPESTAAYDAGSDAAKFLATGVPQIYSLDAANVLYAINERPAGDGLVQLGFTAPAEGTYTIGVTRADVGVMLKDKLTGTTHDFSKGDYSFLAEAGTFNDRFILVQGETVTGINGVYALGAATIDVAKGTITVFGAEGLTTTVVAANGAVVGELFGNGEVSVAPGIYMVSIGDETQKVIVK